MKGATATIIAFFVLGVTLSLYILINPESHALILFKGGRYTEAEAYYTKRYTLGDRSISTVIPLKSLQEKQGNIHAAIALLEEFVEEHPKSYHARLILSELYEQALRRKEYFDSLAILAQMHPKPSFLQELVNWYNHTGQWESEESTLKTLINHHWADAQNYYNYAMLLSSQGRYEEALKSLEERKRRFPEANELNTVAFEVALLSELERLEGDPQKYEEQIFNLIKTYILLSQNGQDAVSLIYELFTQKREKLAYRLLPYLNYLSKHNQPLETLVIELEWLSGQREKAFRRLMQSYRTQPLTAKQAELLTYMTLDKGYYLILTDMFNHIDMESLSAQTLLTIATNSLEKQKPALAEEVSERLSSESFEHHPIATTALLVAADPEQGEARIRQLLETTTLNGSEAFILMQVAAKAGYSTLALEIGSEMLALGHLSQQQMIEWALLYIRYDKAQEGIKQLETEPLEIDPQYRAAALALLQLKAGNVEAARRWLDEQRDPDRQLLIHFYEAADQAEEPLFALDVAKRLYLSFPDPESATYYAMALLSTHQEEQALNVIQKQISPTAPFSLQLVYLHALAANGEGQKAEILLNTLLSKQLKRNELRDLGYLLTNKLYAPDEAEKIFFHLAQKEGPDSSDLRTLLYIWGPRPTQEQIDWLVSRYQHAPEEEQLGWLEVLVQVNEEPLALQLLGEPSGEWTAEKYLVWLTATDPKKERQLFEARAFKALAHINDPSALEAIVQLTEGSDALVVQRAALEKLLLFDPCNSDLFQSLGKTAYELSDFTAAECALNQAAALAPLGIRSLFFMGEILNRDVRTGQAIPYYEAALAELCALEEPDPGQRELVATLYARLKKSAIGIRLLRQLYAENPNPYLQAAIANLYLERGQLGNARDVLYFWDDGGQRDSLTFGWDLPKKNRLSLKAEVDDYSLLLTTPLPLTASTLSEALRSLPPDVAEVETGYNTLLIAMENPTTFEVTSEGGMITLSLSPKEGSERLILPIELARINLALLQRNFVRAFMLIGPLLERYPDNDDLMSLLASAEESTERWQCAMDWLAEAHVVAPEDENVLEAFSTLYFPHRSFLKAQRELQYTRTISTEHFSQLTGEWLALHTPFSIRYLGCQLENLSAHITSIFTPSGDVEGFVGRRTRGYLLYRQENINGHTIEAKGYFSDASGGAALQTKWMWDQTTLALFADWNRPSWEIIEQVAGFGTENRLGVRGEYIHDARLNGALEVSGRQYGIRGLRTATQTILIQGNINLNLTLIDPLFGLDYILDAEYVYDIVERTNSQGEPFNPVPLNSRENHTIHATARQTIIKYLTAEGYVGETFNRLGTHNFTLGFRLHYYNPCGLELEIGAERFPSVTIQGRQQDNVRGAITWRF